MIESKEADSFNGYFGDSFLVVVVVAGTGVHEVVDGAVVDDVDDASGGCERTRRRRRNVAIVATKRRQHERVS